MNDVLYWPNGVSGKTNGRMDKYVSMKRELQRKEIEKGWRASESQIRMEKRTCNEKQTFTNGGE